MDVKPEAQAEANPAGRVLSDKLSARLEALPDLPGVYQMLDKAGAILYVGKAISLRKRVRSYFTGRPDRAKTALLLSRIADLEVIVTGSELEALLLENNLIKKHRPPFNVDLKDDKHYPYVRLDKREPFPRFEIVRRRRADGARYFGPFPAVTALRSTLAVLNKSFSLRRCRGSVFANRVRPCLNHQMGLCQAPCCGLIGQSEYRRLLSAAALVLGGRGGMVLQRLTRRMKKAAQELDFERAAQFRDVLADLKQVMERQNIDAGKDEDVDIIGMIMDPGGRLACYLLTVRRGRMVGGRPYKLDSCAGSPTDLAAAFLQRYYRDRLADERPPALILSSFPLAEGRALEEWLSQRRGARVRIIVPRRGRHLQLLRLAEENARESLPDKNDDDGGPVAGLQELGRQLRLPEPPRVIEGIDISNLGQQWVVASQVVFRDGREAKDEYRRYRLEPPPPDDFARIAVVLARRLAAERPLPDIMLLDGGRPQLEAAMRVLSDLGRELPLLAIAKGRDEEGRRRRRQEDRIFVAGRKNPLKLSPQALRLLQQVRDESHRFAVDYHRRLRGREMVDTELLKVPGIGRQRARKLLTEFGGLEKILPLDAAEIARRARIPLATAAAVERFLQEYKKTTENTGSKSL